VVRVLDSGLSSRLRQRVIRVDGESATEQLETLRFAFTPGEDRLQILQAEVIHAGGQRSRPRGVVTERPGGKQSGVYTLTAFKAVQFNNLHDGDIVHVQVRHDEIGERNLFGRFFGILLPVQDALPKARVELVLDAPAARTLFAKGSGVGEPTRSQDGDRQRLSWSLRDVPALALERGMPGYGDIAAYASVSTYERWSDMAEWYRDLVRPQLELSDDLRAKAGAIVAGTATLAERVAAIQAWVVTNTRYVGIEFGIHGFKPYRVSQVVERGYGDCKDKASLLIALLDAVGVHAEFVLVRTRDLGQLRETPATLWAFNHAIAYVPELDAYIDGTSEFAGLGEVPALDQGAMVLRIDMRPGATGEPTLTTLPFLTAEQNLSEVAAQVRVAADGSAHAAIKDTVRGTQAPEVRRLLHDAERRDERLAGLLGEQYPGARLLTATYRHLDVLGAPVVIEAEVAIPHLARRQGGALVLPLDPDPQRTLNRYGAWAERKQPLQIKSLFEERGVTRFVLPPGARFGPLPAPVKLTTPFGSYELTATAVGDALELVERFRLTVAEVKPADYPAFRAWLGAIGAARAATVTIETGPGGGA
jgi:hypothetical protein